MDGGAWWAAVHGVAKSQTRLSDFTFTFHFHALEKEMATHSSVLAWRIPGTGEPGGLPSMGSHRVRHDRSNLAAAAAGYAEKGTLLHCWWECKLVQPLWRIVWRFLKNNPTPGYISREKHGLKGYMHPSVHCGTVYKSQDMKAT